MIELTGNSLTMEKAFKIVFENEPIYVPDYIWDKVKVSRKAVDDIVANQQVIYGITTGFGKFSNVYIQQKNVEELQLNLIRSHACGTGKPFSETVTRAMVLFRINALLKGLSGIRRNVIELLINLLNYQIHPIVPQQGSLGASGDLAPLSHIALVLVGEGEVVYQDKKMETLEAFDKVGLQPIYLKAKEGLALINGTQAMTAMGAVAYIEAENLALQADYISSLTIEGLHGIIDAFDEDIHLARGYKEQIEVAARIRKILNGSQLVTKQGELRVQDAYSLRCIPQVHGATWQVLYYVKEKLEIEMNAATDNPLIFDNKILSGGNFHGQPIAFAMDFLSIGMAELANISERRVERLVNPQLNDLPPFLSPEPGLQSGAMIMQYCAASLVSENKKLAHPASVDSIPSSANQEDHVSMGTIGSRYAYKIINNTRKVLSIEYICAMQAAEYRGMSKLAPITHQLYKFGRSIVPSIKKDRIFSKDIENMEVRLKALNFEQNFVMQVEDAVAVKRF
ncbi:histidine ammonia-lyase [Cytobacillus sp. FSL W8-0315]|uniref:histidine ammonia-lyase n=1 Tax=Cytobacillus TaxID=2675230 RepID=UPI0001F458D6|nr:histidine ammonia-lyase [Cytobacillus pseudoceanisediminis]EFV74683.1 histidine ammonia-lyase [Bacillus sp. 2_A_57_CT2]UQX56883.1 histidine ammonia-lyase [Cytobacillus pseudoceanisediminis]